jgi:hypothetical protein
MLIEIHFARQAKQMTDGLYFLLLENRDVGLNSIKCFHQREFQINISHSIVETKNIPMNNEINNSEKGSFI